MAKSANTRQQPPFTIAFALATLILLGVTISNAAELKQGTLEVWNS